MQAALLGAFQGEGGSVLQVVSLIHLTVSLTVGLVHIFMDCFGSMSFQKEAIWEDHKGVVRGLFWFLERCGILSPRSGML